MAIEWKTVTDQFGDTEEIAHVGEIFSLRVYETEGHNCRWEVRLGYCLVDNGRCSDKECGKAYCEGFVRAHVRKINEELQ